MELRGEHKDVEDVEDTEVKDVKDVRKSPLLLGGTSDDYDDYDEEFPWQHNYWSKDFVSRLDWFAEYMGFRQEDEPVGVRESAQRRNSWYQH